MPDESNTKKRKSKASMTVDIKADGWAIAANISTLQETAKIVLDAEVPIKRHRKLLLQTTESLLALHKTVTEKIPDLVPDDCTKYSLNCLQAEINYGEMAKPEKMHH